MSKISELPQAAPFVGGEDFPIVQGGQVRRANANDFHRWLANNPPPPPPMPEFVTNFWPMNEGAGTVLTDEVGGQSIDVAAAGYFGGSGNASWNDGRLVLEDYWFWTPASFSGLSRFVIFETDAGVHCYPMSVSKNTGFTTGVTRSSANPRIRLLSGLGIRQLVGRWRDGASAFGASEGGANALYVEKPSAFTNQQLFFNCNREDGAGKVTSGTYRLIAFGLMNKSITLEEMKWLRAWLAARVASDKSIYLTPDVCPNEAAVVWWDGESTNHTSLVMDLSAPLPARRRPFATRLLTTANGNISFGYSDVIRTLDYDTGEVWSGYTLGNEDASAPSGNTGDRARKMGPLIGFAEETLLKGKPHPNLFHFKTARGSTLLAPPGTPIGDAIKFTRYGPVGTGPSDQGTLAHSLNLLGFTVMEATLRNAGYGIKYLTRCTAAGINDAGCIEAGVLTAPSVWRGWRQDEHDYLKRLIGVANLPTVLRVPHLPVPSAEETYSAQLNSATDSDSFKQGYPNDAVGQLRLDNLLQIRAGDRAWFTTEDDVIAILEDDDFPLDSEGDDPTHLAFTGQRGAGSAVYAAANVSSPVIEAFDDVTIEP